MSSPFVETLKQLNLALKEYNNNAGYPYFAEGINIQQLALTRSHAELVAFFNKELDKIDDWYDTEEGSGSYDTYEDMRYLNNVYKKDRKGIIKIMKLVLSSSKKSPKAINSKKSSFGGVF